MQSTSIIAIRHGETPWNALSRIQGHIDIDLNEEGRRQANLLGQAFQTRDESNPFGPIQAIYASDLKRALNTATPLAKALQLQIIQDQRLRERHFGDFEGKTWNDIETHSPEISALWRARDPLWRPGSNAESLSDLDHRIRQAVQQIAAKHLGSQIVIVSHGGVMDILYRWACALDLSVPRSFSIDNAVINRLQWSQEGGLSLIGWAERAHLERASRDEIST
jgi:probable phosphoglycerate mutase